MNCPGNEWIWPDIREPELVERLLMDEDRFLELWLSLVGGFPVRAYDDEAFATGTGYPWPRPSGSFILEEGEGRLLADLDPRESAEAIDGFTGPASGRTPMLAIGSNASPEGLWRKFAHFEDPADRTLLAVSGLLHDFDICASAELALYGALPATVCPSPGTRVAASTIWLTPAQLTQLAWAEIPYLLGRLDARFEFESSFGGEADGLDACLVFVNRFGAFAPEGNPIALAPIAADNRVYSELPQAGLLRIVAELTYGRGTTAEQLVRKAFEEPAQAGPEVTGTMRAYAIRFDSDRWTPYPGPA
jgi:hypothetical protein